MTAVAEDEVGDRRIVVIVVVVVECGLFYEQQ
jgi:hypothetical protein